MHTTVRAALVVAAVSAFLVGTSAAAQAAPALPLNPGQEVAEIDSDGHGFFTYEIDGDQFCWTLDVWGLTTPAAAAHVHEAARNVNGGIRIHLETLPRTSFETAGCETVSDTALLMRIQENPRGFYVNVHTSTYPGGEIRGQLKK
ncbi:CHRD domain-containing protein [Microbacterium sp. SS28]|uniref:CHRD domain-containing protein n=1 Tax=Microbacterium sp. SS28 TaxID=2919948 RepID=UPI001FAA9F7E|nr:CHRD domain-containing protein [Microbacterium sp. SS28]